MLSPFEVFEGLSQDVAARLGMLHDRLASLQGTRAAALAMKSLADSDTVVTMSRELLRQIDTALELCVKDVLEQIEQLESVAELYGSVSATESRPKQ